MNFNMKSPFIAALLLTLLFQIAPAQKIGPIWLDRDGDIVEDSSYAESYRMVIPLEEEALFRVEEDFLSGKTKMIGHFHAATQPINWQSLDNLYDKESELLRHGRFSFYEESGFLKDMEAYDMGKDNYLVGVTKSSGAGGDTYKLSLRSEGLTRGPTELQYKLEEEVIPVYAHLPRKPIKGTDSIFHSENKEPYYLKYVMEHTSDTAFGYVKVTSFYPNGKTQMIRHFIPKTSAYEYGKSYRKNALGKIERVKDSSLNIKSALHDTLMSWYENGQVKDVLLYKKGKQHGRQLAYHPNGQRKNDIFFQEGTPVNRIMAWHDNGQCSMEVALDDKGNYHGDYVEWSRKGIKIAAITLLHGKADGLIFFWHDNGQKKEKFLAKNNVKIGTYQSWYDNGEKRVIGYFAPVYAPDKEMAIRTFTTRYAFNKEIPIGTEQDGKWTWLDQKGEVVKITWYDMGKVIKEEILQETQIAKPLARETHCQKGVFIYLDKGKKRMFCMEDGNPQTIYRQRIEGEDTLQVPMAFIAFKGDEGACSYKEYHPNGTLSMEGAHGDSQNLLEGGSGTTSVPRTGEWKFWDSTGVLTETIFYVGIWEAERHRVAYYPNGQIKQEKLKEVTGDDFSIGEDNKALRRWFSNGRLMDAWEKEGDRSVYKKWTADGALIMHYTYMKGEKDGPQYRYTLSEELLASPQYDKGKRIDE